MTKLHRKLTWVVVVAMSTTLLLSLTWSPKPRIKDKVEKDALHKRILQRISYLPLQNYAPLLRNSTQRHDVHILQQISHSGNKLKTKEQVQIRQQTIEESKVINNSKFTYSNYDVNHPRYVSLKDDHGDYFFERGGFRCLKEGTENATSKCACKTGWHGANCSIPDIVDERRFANSSRLRVRQGTPRRIIFGITFNVEFEMLEIRMRDMGDLIDLIIIVESNYTGFGDRKGLFLLEKLKNGFLQEYQDKIVHIFLDHFPTGSDPKDGGYTDFYTKDYPGKEGLRHVRDTRKDDIFIVADSDELLRREALLFLKHHDGYPEPIGAYFRRNAFGFYWYNDVSLLGVGCSLDMLETVYQNKVGQLRGATSTAHKFVVQLEDYRKKTGKAVQMWNMGSASPASNIAGWHCSWCFEPERVRIKLLSAYNYDFPRWGNYPAKTRLDFISKLIKSGMWFDERKTFTPLYIGRDAPFAPPYVLRNFDKFKRILFNPYQKL